jgi:hypothetical protein
VLLASKSAAAAPLPRDLSHDVPGASRPRAVDLDTPRRKTETSGLGLSAGLGSQYAFFGVQAAYYLQRPRALVRVAPYGGVGLLCLEDECTTGWMLGAMGSWGQKHRLLVDLFYGTVTAYGFQLHGEPSVTKTFTGTGLAVGYEYMAFCGFFVRGSIGGAYAFGPPIKAPLHRIQWMLTPLGIGYKFW